MTAYLVGSGSPNFRFFTAGAMIMVIVMGMLTPNIGIPGHHVDKVVHWGVFFSAGVFLIMLLKLPARIVIPVLAFLAVFLELGQNIVPGRQASVADLFANVTGILSFAVASMGYQTVSKKRRSAGLSQDKKNIVGETNETLPAMFEIPAQPANVRAILFSTAVPSFPCEPVHTPDR